LSVCPAAGLATLLFDLLSEDEAQQRHNVFDIALLASRLQLAVEWLQAEGAQLAGKCPPGFPLGFFGASTGRSIAVNCSGYHSGGALHDQDQENEI
jgi:hypothetical protein